MFIDDPKNNGNHFPFGSLFPISNEGMFKGLPNDIKFDERIIAFDDVNGQMYITTVNKIYKLEQDGSSFNPVRIW